MLVGAQDEQEGVADRDGKKGFFVETWMRVDDQDVEVQAFDECPEAFVEEFNVVALAQHLGDVGGLDAGWHEVQRSGCGAHLRGDIVCAFDDWAAAVEIVVEHLALHLFVEAEKNMNPWRLHIGVDYCDTLSGKSELRRNVGARIALPSSTTK